jgi:L-alanine-DL-glutamate epimerase-like enolase superfamily enzyme
MRLLTISLYRHKKPFQLSFQSAHMLRAHSESVLVRLDFDNAVIGYGESAPRPYVTGENLSTVTRLVQDRFAPLLLGRDIDSLEDVERSLEDLESACLRKKIHHYQSALGSIDIALLDALGKLHQVPMGQLIGPQTGREVPLSISVPFLPAKSIKALFPHFRHHKFQYVKVLVGNDMDANEERVGLIRSLFGEETDLRIEANGKWHYEEAVTNLSRLKPYHISAVEQPLDKENLVGLRRLRRQTAVPIIADESVCSLSDARTLLESEACDMFNIKISKCGGLLRSKRIVDFALSRNVPCQLGSHVGETEILTAAAKHFLMSVTNLLCFEGLSHLLFQNLQGEPQMREVGEIDGGALGSGWGLGVSPERLLNQDCSSPVEPRSSDTI